MEGPVMMDPLVATEMFSGPTTIVSVLAVSAAEALSPLLHALSAASAKRPSTTGALFLMMLQSCFFIYTLAEIITVVERRSVVPAPARLVPLECFAAAVAAPLPDSVPEPAP